MTKIPDDIFKTPTDEKTKPKTEAHINEQALNLGMQRTNKNEIAKLIGEGENAKNSIVWIIIRWSLIIPSGITILYFITMWGVYILDPKIESTEQVNQIRENILKIWSVFAPLVTLALGYIYGKGSEK